MQNPFQILEMDAILAQVANYAKTEAGKAHILSLRPYAERGLIEELSFQSAFIAVSPFLGTLSFGDGCDLSYPLSKAGKGGRLEIQEFLSLVSYIDAGDNAKGKLENIEENNVVTEFISYLPDLDSLKEEIQRVITPDGHIYDNASPTLKTIRKNLNAKKREANSILPSLLKRYQPYLNSTSFAFKNEHYTLPVSISYKNKIRGLLIDLSASENTAFIEPEELLLIQNEIAELEAEEKQEIMVLLSKLSSHVAAEGDEAKRLYEGLVTLDIAQAKAEYGLANKGHLACLSEDGSLLLQAARHPLLDPTKVVANDFRLLSDAKVVVLSGPNAGGKTVALKTLAVNILLFEMGIPCLAEQGGQIPYFKHVYTDIGDSQSIQDNLSTFSGHMANIAAICASAGGRDIVFLDEVGTGTSPKEGESLAIAILEYLENKHAYVLVSSHFEGLKALALENPRFDNASLIYDEENFTPTYRLRFGSPGESYGLLAAKRFGLQEEILTSAKKRLSAKGEGGVAYAIKKLTKLQKENEELSASLKKKEDELKEESRRLKVQTHNFQKQKEEFESSLDEQREKALKEAREEVGLVIKELSRPGLKLHEAIAMKGRLDKLGQKEEAPTPKKEPGVFSVGDFVSIVDFSIEGRISQIQGKTITVSTPQGKDFKVEARLLEHIDLLEEEKPDPIKGALLDGLGSLGVNLECNLIGMRAEEARYALDGYLDICRMAGFNRVRIIHGFGSGALRKMTHEYLRTHKEFVASFELAGPQEGGSGATVVYLK